MDFNFYRRLPSNLYKQKRQKFIPADGNLTSSERAGELVASKYQVVASRIMSRLNSSLHIARRTRHGKLASGWNKNADCADIEEIPEVARRARFFSANA